MRNMDKGHFWGEKSPPRRIVRVATEERNIEKGHYWGKKSPPRIVFKENPEQVVTRRRGSSILQRARTQIREIS